MASKLQISERLKEVAGPSIWVEFGQLATEHKALNLGQGFPDFSPPEYIKQAMVDSVMSNNVFLNQYTRSYGHPRLVNALAKVYSPLLERQVDPMNEILITVGAYGSLFCAVQGLVNPGDECIIIEPFFDCYEPMVKVAGGTPVFVPLRPNKTSGGVLSSADWKLDPAELESKFSDKTKLIFLNTPNNPVGKMFTKDELQMIADLCIKHDVVCIADEVYEWLTYDGNKHIKIATLPGMWERTITIGSAGKTFSVTGWKIGWAIAPNNLMSCLHAIHQNCNYTCPTPIQEAIAVGFEVETPKVGQPDCYFHELPAELKPRRDKMAKILQECGITPTVPEGGYFMIADLSGLNLDCEDGTDSPNDFKIVRWLTKNKKLATIPPSAFYGKEHKHLAQNLIRFCFCKEDKNIDKAGDILREWKKSM